MNGIHSFWYIKDISYADIFKTEKYADFFWDVAFVDHSPPEARRYTVEALRTRAKYIVVHDAEPLAVAYNWGNLFDTFKYKCYDDTYGNGTIIVSDNSVIEME
jgi:hypothetical protein